MVHGQRAPSFGSTKGETFHDYRHRLISRLGHLNLRHFRHRVLRMNQTPGACPNSRPPLRASRWTRGGDAAQLRRRDLQELDRRVIENLLRLCTSLSNAPDGDIFCCEIFPGCDPICTSPLILPGVLKIVLR